MLITSLVEFARHEGLAGADPFFETKPVRWLMVIAPGGRFVQLLRLGDGPKGMPHSVPKKVGGNAGGVATFGVDNPRFVLGHMEGTPDAKKLARDLGAFGTLIAQAAREHPQEAAFAAAAAFYQDPRELEAARAAAATMGVKDGDRIAVAFAADQNTPLFDSPAGRGFWRRYREEQEAGKPRVAATRCLACGEMKPPVLTAEKLMGVPDGQPSGTALVSFDKDAFQSMDWDQNTNAPICEDCSLAYTRGLNHLLDRSHTPRTRVDQGGVAFQFWLDSGSAGEFIENWFEAPDSEEAEQVLTAARTGLLPPGAPERRLFALGLRGNGGRAVVTDWFDTSLADAYRNLARWFDDLEVRLARDEREKGTTYRHTGQLARPPRLWVLCRATARADDEISPRTPSALFRAALRGERLPLFIAESCIRRLPLDGFDDFFAPARIGLIRCTLNRRNRGERELMAGLDPENDHPAYLCGRLLATLEAIQYAGVRDVNATIVDRYYGKASTAPALVFGPLLTLAQNHLGAIRSEGTRIALDRELAEIIGRLGASFPKTLDLESQGRFAVGYYHQKAHRFAEIQKRRDERTGNSDFPETEE